jgi:6-phosphogluconolactonase
MSESKVNWQHFETAQAVADEAVKRILAAASKAIAERGIFRLVLAGGTTPGVAYRMLKDADTDWSKWEIFHGDERCLPPDDKERNSLMANQLWLDYVAIPDENNHIIKAELGAEAGRDDYEKVIAGKLPFDMVLLGMGEDGHTASLFPGHANDANESMHAIHNSPKPPPDRVSMSASTLGDTRELLILVTGAGKQEAVAQWKTGVALPVATINPSLAEVLIDQAAWGEG